MPNPTNVCSALCSHPLKNPAVPRHRSSSWSLWRHRATPLQTWRVRTGHCAPAGSVPQPFHLRSGWLRCTHAPAAVQTCECAPDTAAAPDCAQACMIKAPRRCRLRLSMQPLPLPAQPRLPEFAADGNSPSLPQPARAWCRKAASSTWGRERRSLGASRTL